LRIYTRSGDKGETTLFGGKRVPKDETRVEAYGTVDELNSHLGFCLLSMKNQSSVNLIDRIQRDLFAIGAMLASPDKSQLDEKSKLTESSVDYLERNIDNIEKQLQPIQAFILPGGSEPAARFHVARAVCRRAERKVVALLRKEEVDPVIVKYLNRLSSLLFVLARYENKLAGETDTFWK
jgi:cob(I)alamin adenosyltransferase